MREFIQTIRSVQKIDDLGDLRLAVVETKSRWNPRAQPRVWRIWTDVWEGGVRRCKAQMYDVPDRDRVGETRQVTFERKAAEEAIVAHLDAVKTKRPSLAAMPWPADPFIGTRPTTRSEVRKRGTYPQTKKEFVEAIGTFDRAKVEAALW